MLESGTMSDELRRRDRPVIEAKIVVPEGMLKAASVAYNSETSKLGYRYVIDRYVVQATLEAALCWLSENPIVPTEKQADEIYKLVANQPSSSWLYHKLGVLPEFAIEFQRIMFNAPEPEFPEELRALLLPEFFNALQAVTGETATRSESRYREAVLKAYRIGQKSKEFTK